MSKKSSWVQRATGTKRYGWTTKRHVNLGADQVTHSFLVIPECPAPLLGRDLLSKVNAQIHFDHGQVSVLDGTGHPLQVLSLTLKDKYRLYLPEAPATISPKVQPWVQRYPQAWDKTAGMGLAKQRPPIIVELKASASSVRVRQYPIESRGSTRNYSSSTTPHRCWGPKKVPVPMEHSPVACEKSLGELILDRFKIYEKSTNG